jgi:hypothetical protein
MLLESGHLEDEEEKMDLGRQLHRLEMYRSDVGLYLSMPGSAKSIYFPPFHIMFGDYWPGA